MRSILFIALFMAAARPARIRRNATPPDTAYSAVRTVEAQGMTMNSKVYYDRGTERWETT